MPNDIQEVAEKVVKKQKRPNRSAEMVIQSEPGENSRYLEHSRMIAELPDADMKDNVSVAKRIDQYFDICQCNDMKPTIAGLALAFGLSRVEMWKISTGQVKSVPPRVVNTIKKAYALINSQMEDYMQNGKINPVAGIFLMKNNMGYTDKTEIVVEPTSGEPEASELIEAAELLPED